MKKRFSLLLTSLILISASGFNFYDTETEALLFTNAELSETDENSAEAFEGIISNGESSPPDVSIPDSLPFSLDPYEITPYGQIYSDVFQVSNNSASGAFITIDSVLCEMDPAGGLAPDDIQLILRCTDALGETTDIAVTPNRPFDSEAEAVSFVLSPSGYEGSSFSFIITGSINPFIINEVDWEFLNISVEATFQATTADEGYREDDEYIRQ